MEMGWVGWEAEAKSTLGQVLYCAVTYITGTTVPCCRRGCRCDCNPSRSLPKEETQRRPADDRIFYVK